jgi:hypothetical protein
MSPQSPSPAVADLVMGTLGGEMKRRESLSARLGDCLSELYLMSCALKRFEDDGCKREDLPLVEWNYLNTLYTIQARLDEVLQNLPNRPIAWFLRLIAFPLGRFRRLPSDRLAHRCAALILVGNGNARTPDKRHLCQPHAHRSGRPHGSGLCCRHRARRHRGQDQSLPDSPGAKRWPIFPISCAIASLRRWKRMRSHAPNAIIRDAIDVDDFAPSELTGRESSTIHSAAAE